MKTYIEKKCEGCNSVMKIPLITQKWHKRFGKIIKGKNKKYCSNKCYLKICSKRFIEMNISNSGKTLEEIHGIELALNIKNKQSKRMTENNISTNPEVAKKISDSLKLFLKENPETRLGENNPFFGKSHTHEYKLWSSESRSGKTSFNEEQYEKLLENVLKGEDHPNWKGGISNEPYPFGFNKQLKEEIKRNCDYKCMICDKKTQKLVIHHIDYDKSNISKENLISLCTSCHSKTNFKRDSWIKFFDNLINNKK